MKNRLFSCITIISLILAFLTGCVGRQYPFYETIDKITSIEIVSVQTRIEHTVIYTLSEEEQESFLEQFQEIKFYKYVGDPPSVYGNAIKITYQSGVFDIICPFVSEYVKDGRVYTWLRHCDEEEFNNLINPYLEQ